MFLSLFLSYVLDLATHKVPGSASWRVPVGLQLLLGLILLSGILFLPESPYVSWHSLVLLATELIHSIQATSPWSGTR